MYTFETLGKALTHLKLAPGNTIRALSDYPEMYNYTERDLSFTSGGTTEIIAGDWIVGATSGAAAEVVSVTLSSGTWAGGDAAGTLRIRSQNGTFVSENIKVAAGTDDATVAANSTVAVDNYPFKGVQARAALVSVSSQTAQVGLTGGKPDQTYLAGHQMAAASSIILRDKDSIRNFKFVDAVSGSASTVQITFFY